MSFTPRGIDVTVDVLKRRKRGIGLVIELELCSNQSKRENSGILIGKLVLCMCIRIYRKTERRSSNASLNCAFPHLKPRCPACGGEEGTTPPASSVLTPPASGTNKAETAEVLAKWSSPLRRLRKRADPCLRHRQKVCLTESCG